MSPVRHCVAESRALLSLEAFRQGNYDDVNVSSNRAPVFHVWNHVLEIDPLRPFLRTLGVFCRNGNSWKRKQTGGKVLKFSVTSTEKISGESDWK